MTKNRYSKVIKHLKSTELDEKIKSLEEAAPTNSMGGVYAISDPGQRYGKKDPEKTFYANLDGTWPAGVPGTPGERKYVRPIGYWEEGPGAVPSVQHDEIVELDFSYDTQTDDPRNTKTLIDETTGRVKTELPPNSRSFILGPLVDMYFQNHGYDNRTYVGYIQKDTREFVLLGSVAGTWGDDDNGDPINADGYEGFSRVWNGLESSFTATNPNFTFEMLQWHHDRLKEGKYVKNVAYFNSGGTPVARGAGGTGQPGGTTQGNVSGTPTGGDAGNNGDADQTHGSGGNPDIGTQQSDPVTGDPDEAGYPWPPEGEIPDDEVLFGMNAEELAELGFNLLNLGLDLAALAGILFPEPGTTAAGFARLAMRFGMKAGPKLVQGARVARGAQNLAKGARAARGSNGLARKLGLGGNPKGLARGLKGADVGATGLKKGGYDALKGGQGLHKGSKGFLSPGGKGVYSSPNVGKVGPGGFRPGSGGARYAKSGSNPLGGAQGKSGAPGGVVGSITPGGARGTKFIEPQRVVNPQTFRKGQKLFQKVQGGAYPKSSRANQFRQKATKAGFKSGQTDIPFSQLPKASKPKSPAKSFKQWYNRGRKPGENTMRWGDPRQLVAKDPSKVNKNTLFGNDRLQRGQSNAAFDSGKKPGVLGRPDRSVLGRDLDPRSPEFLKKVSPERGGPGSAPTPAIRQAIERPARAIGRAYSQTPTAVKAAAGASLASVLGAPPAKGQVTSLQKTIQSVDNPDGTTNFDKLDSLLKTDPKAFGDYIQHRLNAPKTPTVLPDIAPTTPSGGTLDSKTSSQIDSLLKSVAKPGSTKSDTINRRLLKLYDKLPPGDPRGEEILNKITAGSGSKPKGIGKTKMKLPGEMRFNTDRGDLTNERTFSDFQILTEDYILYEQEAAATAVEPAPTNAVQANNGNITPEQEQKVNDTADQFADAAAEGLSDEEVAELAVDAESEVAKQEAEQTNLSDDPVEAFNQILDIVNEYDIPLSDVTADQMDQLFSLGDQLAILNGTDPGTQAKFMEILGLPSGILTNFTDDTYRTLSDWQSSGWRWWYLKPGGTPTTGWDGKFYMYDDPQLEVSRIVSLDEYQKAKERPDFYGLETPDVAEPGSRYKIVPPRYKGGKESYELTGVTQFNANAVDRARRILGTGQLGGRSGLGLSWEYSVYKGEIRSELTGYAGAAYDAVRLATQYLEHVLKNNLESDIVADRISNLQRYPGIYGAEGKPNQLTDDTWNVYDFTWGNAARDMDWVFSLNSNDILSPESAYGSSGRYASAKRDADRLWKKWESVKEFGLSLKQLDWKKYDNDKWYGDGEFSKSHPLLGIAPPETEGPRDGYNYYPEFDDIEDVPSRITAEDVKPTIDDLGAAGFAAYKAGGGDAKVKQGLTVAEVIAQGKINLAAILPGSPLQKPIQNPEQNSPNLFKGVVELVGELMIQTGSPLDLRGGPSEVFRVQTQIAKSILQNEPIRSTAASAYEIRSVMEVIEKDAMNVDALQAMGWEDPTMTTLNGVVIVDEPRNYSDDHIYEDDNGVVRTHTNETRKRYPSTVGNIPGRNAEGIAVRPIAERGEAQLEIVVPRDGSEPYLRYLDHAYLNINYAPGEVAQGWQEWIAKQIVNLRDFVQGGRGHTGAFKNYPDFIKGDERLEFTVPYNQMSESLKRIIDRYRKVPGKITSTDAAVAAAERARREEEERKKKQRRRGQGGRSLGDTTERGGMQESNNPNRKRILREIKQPYKMKETPKQKYKMNFKGKFRPQNTPDVTASKQSEETVKAKNAAGQVWRTQDKYWGGYESQERMNVIYDHIGHGDMYWDMIVNENQNKKGIRDRKIQEHLNMINHEKEMRKIDSNYQRPTIDEQETMQYDNDPLVKKVLNKIKSQVDYPNKPSPEGYPIKPPLETVDGYHPNMGQQKDAYYKKLDPHSAEAMPSTGDEKIDANVAKATDAKTKARKIKNLLGKRVDG